MKRLDNKVAIITGSGSGIGKEIAFTYAKEGAKVVIADFSEEAMNQTVGELKEAGHETYGVIVNVGVNEDIECIIGDVIREYGQIDILVIISGDGYNMQYARLYAL